MKLNIVHSNWHEKIAQKLGLYKMKIHYTLWVVLIVLITKNSIAQHPIRLSLAGKEYYIPNFKEDSTISFSNLETKNKIINPITTSDAPVEVRLYIQPKLKSKDRIIETQKYYNPLAELICQSMFNFSNRLVVNKFV